MGNEAVVTVEQVMDWHPCYEYAREDVVALFAGRDVLSARDIAALDISFEDRFLYVLEMG